MENLSDNASEPRAECLLICRILTISVGSQSSVVWHKGKRNLSTLKNNYENLIKTEGWKSAKFFWLIKIN